MQKNSMNISKSSKENSWRMVLQWIKFKSNIEYLFRLKKNNIYIQIYDKLNNPDREQTNRQQSLPNKLQKSKVNIQTKQEI